MSSQAQRSLAVWPPKTLLDFMSSLFPFLAHKFCLLFDSFCTPHQADVPNAFHSDDELLLGSYSQFRTHKWTQIVQIVPSNSHYFAFFLQIHSATPVPHRGTRGISYLSSQDLTISCSFIFILKFSFHCSCTEMNAQASRLLINTLDNNGPRVSH